MVQQPLVGGGAAAAADGAGPTTERNPRMRGGIRDLAAGQMRMVWGSQQDFLPPRACLVAWRLLWDHSGGVDVVILQM